MSQVTTSLGAGALRSDPKCIAGAGSEGSFLQGIGLRKSGFL